MLGHAKPVHYPLAVAASLGLAYGLWRHRWPWIIGSTALAGHVYCWTRPEERTFRELGSAEGDTSVLHAGRAVAPVPAQRPPAEGAGTR